MGCAISCSETLEISRSKFNREENAINTNTADRYTRWEFVSHFSVQPQLSPSKSDLIAPSRTSD